MEGLVSDLLSDLSSGDDQRAANAVTEISSMPGKQRSDLLERLQQLMASPDVDTRWWATRSIAEISDDQVPALLMNALDDLDSSVRQCAALGLRFHANSESVPALLNALEDHDSLVARLASLALVAVGEEAVLGLIETMQNSSQSARLEAARALATIGDHRSIPVLFDALEQDSALLEYWANEGLERMGVGMVFFSP